MKTLRVAAAQMNPMVGDIPRNAEKIERFTLEALERGADCVLFPEMALVGYPPEDLLLREDFISENLRALERVVEFSRAKDILMVVGFVDRTEKGIHNAAGIVYRGELVDVYHKILLPNYGVFDDKRYFVPGERFPVYGFKGLRIGVNVCEDIWHRHGPTGHQAARGAQLILNINASPYHMGKWSQRQNMLAERARENGVFVVYVNSVGGQDELVFDGDSMALDPEGNLLARARLFTEELLVLDLEPGAGREDSGFQEVIPVAGGELKQRSERLRPLAKAPETPEEEVWQALLMGTRDYITKNGFKRVVVGLSGGIDSGLVATLARDAVGPENVLCLFMPSRYTSEQSRQDAFRLAENLGVKITEIPIDPLFDAYLSALKPHFKATEPGIAEENIQARIRGNLLMAFSNKFGHLVLTTGNKSEMSCGYATLYGDLSGGFAPLKDVPKTMVYRLARHRNSRGRVIPETMLTKPPSAELKPDQTDQDTLPPYKILDPILHLYIEEDASPEEILARGFGEAVVRKVVAMVDKSEYKRRQAPPGIKITQRAFGRDRRMPITNGFRRG